MLRYAMAEKPVKAKLKSHMNQGSEILNRASQPALGIGADW
jgi:hypothetical protein